MPGWFGQNSWYVAINRWQDGHSEPKTDLFVESCWRDEAKIRQRMGEVFSLGWSVQRGDGKNEREEEDRGRLLTGPSISKLS